MHEKTNKTRRKFLGLLAAAAATPLILGRNSPARKVRESPQARKPAIGGECLTLSPLSNVGIGVNTASLRLNVGCP